MSSHNTSCSLPRMSLSSYCTVHSGRCVSPNSGYICSDLHSAIRIMFIVNSMETNHSMYTLLPFLFNRLYIKYSLVTSFLKPDTQTPEPHTKSAK